MSTDLDLNLYYITLIFNVNDFNVLTYKNSKYSIYNLIENLSNSYYNQNKEYLNSINSLPFYVYDDDDSSKSINVSLTEDNISVLIKGKINLNCLKSIKDIIINNNSSSNIEEIKQSIQLV